MRLDPVGTLCLFVRRVRSGEREKLHLVAVSEDFKQRQGPEQKSLGSQRLEEARLPVLEL